MEPTGTFVTVGSVCAFQGLAVGWSYQHKRCAADFVTFSDLTTQEVAAGGVLPIFTVSTVSFIEQKTLVDDRGSLTIEKGHLPRGFPNQR